LTTILATLDGSSESQAILPVLTKLAKDTNAEVKLLTVVERVHATGPRPTGPERMRPSTGPPVDPTLTIEAIRKPSDPRWAETEDQAIARLHSEGREYLEDLARPLREGGLKVEENVLMDDDVARAIIEFATREKVDIIAMATHGRTGLREIVQGSVASAVVKSGVAPVLLVRPRK
jgi:nucleotide-binding universal stress UspA family protein